MHDENRRLLVLSDTLSVRSFQLSLLQMSDGCPHPDAAEPIIFGTEFGPWQRICDISVQATGLKLAVKVSLDLPTTNGSEGKHDNLFIWDWRTGQKYIVSGIPSFFSAVGSELDLFPRIVHTLRSIRCASLTIHVSSAWYQPDPVAQKRWCYGTPLS